MARVGIKLFLEKLLPDDLAQEGSAQQQVLHEGGPLHGPRWLGVGGKKERDLVEQSGVGIAGTCWAHLAWPQPAVTLHLLF